MAKTSVWDAKRRRIRGKHSAVQEADDIMEGNNDEEHLAGTALSASDLFEKLLGSAVVALAKAFAVPASSVSVSGLSTPRLDSQRDTEVSQQTPG